MEADQRKQLVEGLLSDPSKPALSRAIAEVVQARPLKPTRTVPISRGELACMIDHTVLKANATFTDIDLVCNEAVKHRFAAVCIPSCFVRHAARRLEATPMAVCTVVGFPLGNSHTASKVAETRQAVSDGASEIDMVINIGHLTGGRYDLVAADIQAVADCAENEADGNIVVKAILETALLSDHQKVIGSLLCEYAGADYVKTSTGFAAGGATTGDIALIRHAVGPETGIKASGGIRTYSQAAAMIRHGANRIGASNGVALLDQQ